ncbi:hypothetical protein FQ179_17250 [Pusillimonas sp. ANT_WB101]|nr:hypothetical protein FQ179_17250 [Pusillimonas sp. ANT_WB101]
MPEHARAGSGALKTAGIHTRLAASAQATAGAAAEANVMATEKATAEAADQVTAQPTANTVAQPLAPAAALPAAHMQASLLSATALMPRSRYLDHIEALRGSIARGEIYQANYTFPIAIETCLSPQTLYREIASRHPCAHAAYVEDEGRTLLSFSPELFFARSGSTLTVRPMKGTAPRFADPEQDHQSGQQLLHSEKNRAENLMIVDLLRNDLGRVATPGTVKVDALFTLEQYPSVWTLTSTVTAQAPDASLETLLRALFPCGSITGAPKIAAMKKIREREMAERGIYCGSIGWLAPNGDCSLNVAIRTITMQGDAPEDGQAGLSDHTKSRANQSHSADVPGSQADQDQNAELPDRQASQSHNAEVPDRQTSQGHYAEVPGSQSDHRAAQNVSLGGVHHFAAPRFHGVFGVGGGIVYDSEPELEWQECLWKARILGSPPGFVDEVPIAEQPPSTVSGTQRPSEVGMSSRSSQWSFESRADAKRQS